MFKCFIWASHIRWFGLHEGQPLFLLLVLYHYWSCWIYFWHNGPFLFNVLSLKGILNKIVTLSYTVAPKSSQYGLFKLKTGHWLLAIRAKGLFHLHEVVVDASQAVGGAHIRLLVPLVHQRAVVLHPELPAEVLAWHKHSLTDLRKETTHPGSQTVLVCRIERNQWRWISAIWTSICARLSKLVPRWQIKIVWGCNLEVR